VGYKMKAKGIFPAAASLMGLLVVAFLAANFLVGSGSTATVIDVARAKCVEDGFEAQNMAVNQVYTDNGMFGFGGFATVELARVGPGPRDPERPRVLRVELRRRMNLAPWEVVSVSPEP
jgi:hypothetical protein